MAVTSFSFQRHKDDPREAKDGESDDEYVPYVPLKQRRKEEVS